MDTIDRTTVYGDLAAKILNDNDGNYRKAMLVARSCAHDFGGKGIGAHYNAAAEILEAAYSRAQGGGA